MLSLDWHVGGCQAAERNGTLSLVFLGPTWSHLLPYHSGVCSICPLGCLCIRSCGGAATEQGWIGGGCSPEPASSGLVTLQCGAPCGDRRRWTGLPQDSRSHGHFFLQVNYGSGCSVVPGQRRQPVIRKPWHPGHTSCCPFSGTSSRCCFRS